MLRSVGEEANLLSRNLPFATIFLKVVKFALSGCHDEMTRALNAEQNSGRPTAGLKGGRITVNIPIDESERVFAETHISKIAGCSLMNKRWIG